MRILSMRLIVSLILGITLVSLLSSYYEVLREKRGLRSDLEHRAEVLADSLAGNVEKTLEQSSNRGLQRFVQRFGNREHLVGVAVYDPQGTMLATTPDLDKLLGKTPTEVNTAILQDQNQSTFMRVGSRPMHLYAVPLHQETNVIGGLLLVHDAEYIRAESERVWRGE